MTAPNLTSEGGGFKSLSDHLAGCRVSVDLSSTPPVMLVHFQPVASFNAIMFSSYIFFSSLSGMPVN